MILETDIKLQESFSAYYEGNFEEVLFAELEQQSFELPLQRFCDHGGWPDDESLTFGIEGLTETNGRVVVTISCFFTELVPTGCADIQHSASGQGSFEIVLDLGDNRAFYVYDSDNG